MNPHYIEPMSPDERRRIQAMRDKATRAWKPAVRLADKKFVATQVKFHKLRRDQKRAQMVANGQMRGGFSAD
jgi:hypothetical protein